MTRPADSEALQFPDHWKLFVTEGGRTEPLPSLPRAGEPKPRILIADDDSVSRELLTARLEQWGYDAVAVSDGQTALMELRKSDAPALAILDWMMPGATGIEICQRTREADRNVYLILLTSRDGKSDVAEGLNAGADDYVSKPFDKEELHARIKVGFRIIGLQRALARKAAQLELLTDNRTGVSGNLGAF